MTHGATEDECFARLLDVIRSGSNIGESIVLEAGRHPSQKHRPKKKE